MLFRSRGLLVAGLVTGCVYAGAAMCWSLLGGAAGGRFPRLDAAAAAAHDAAARVLPAWVPLPPRYDRLQAVDAEELGGAMTEKLAELFDESPAALPVFTPRRKAAGAR